MECNFACSKRAELTASTTGPAPGMCRALGLFGAALEPPVVLFVFAVS